MGYDQAAAFNAMKLKIDSFINWVRIRSPQAKTWWDYRCDLQVFANVMKGRDVREIRFRDVDEHKLF